MKWMWRFLRRSDEIDDLRNQLTFSQGDTLSLKKKLAQFMAPHGSQFAKDYIKKTEGRDWDEKYSDNLQRENNDLHKECNDKIARRDDQILDLAEKLELHGSVKAEGIVNIHEDCEKEIKHQFYHISGLTIKAHEYLVKNEQLCKEIVTNEDIINNQSHTIERLRAQLAEAQKVEQ